MYARILTIIIVSPFAYGAQSQKGTTVTRLFIEPTYHFLWWNYPAAAWEAWFTLGLIATGIIGAAVVAWQSCLLRKQVALARREFNIVHRPRLVPKAIFTIADPVNRRVNVSFAIQNAGDLPAEIKFTECKFFVSVRDVDGSTEMPTCVFSNYQNHISTISVGEEQRYRVCLGDSAILAKCFFPDSTQTSAPAIADVSFTFRGDIAYLDAVRETRHCSFLRAYDFLNRHFSHIRGSEFDYDR